MKIALICGSPKHKRSASQALLAGLQHYLAPSDQVETFCFPTAVPDQRDLLRLCTCSTLVFAFPLYVDGVPGHLVACLQALEETLRIAPGRERMVYALCNCGFYEGEQAGSALDIMTHWSRRCGLRWGGGLGVGGGGMLGGEPVPMGKGPTKDLGKALMTLAHEMDVGREGPNRFTTINLPRAAYKAAGELGWRRAIKRNGLHAKDLDLRP